MKKEIGSKVLPKDALLERFNNEMPKYLRIGDLGLLLGTSSAEYICRTNQIPRYRYREANTNAYIGTSLLKRTRMIDIDPNRKENLKEAIITHDDLNAFLKTEKGSKLFHSHPLLKTAFQEAFIQSPAASYLVNTGRIKTHNVVPYDQHTPSTKVLDRFQTYITEKLNRLLECYPKRNLPKSIEELELDIDGSCTIPEHILNNDPDLQDIIELIQTFLFYDFEKLYELCSKIDSLSKNL